MPKLQGRNCIELVQRYHCYNCENSIIKQKHQIDKKNEK